MPILITVLAVLAVYMIHKCRRFIKKTVHPRRVMKRNREILQASGLFRVISCLGMGRNGVVFEISQADSSGSSDTAALKVIYSTRHGSPALIMGRLQHLKSRLHGLPGEIRGMIPALHHIGMLKCVTGEIPYVIYEKIEGRSIREHSRMNYFSDIGMMGTALLVDDMVDLVTVLEEHDLFPIDPRPSNFMVNLEGRLKLIDITSIREANSVTSKYRCRSIHKICRTLMLMLDQALKGVEGASDRFRLAEVLAQIRGLYRKSHRAEDGEMRLTMLRPLRDEICRDMKKRCGGG